MRITENMKVCDVLEMGDSMEQVFQQHGLLCTGCPGAAQETLREAADGHSIDIDNLLADLNNQA